MLRLILLLTAFVFALLLVACRFGAGEEAAAAPGGASAMAAPDTCPVTLAPEPRFAPPEPYPETPSGGQFWYGDESLWTGLPGDGTWRLPHHEHGFTQKLPWWRVGYDWQEEPLPALEVRGRRLDGEASVFLATDATNGYYPDYESFMMTGFAIPSQGCWEITGQYEDSELSFVVWVEG